MRQTLHLGLQVYHDMQPNRISKSSKGQQWYAIATEARIYNTIGVRPCCRQCARVGKERTVDRRPPSTKPRKEKKVTADMALQEAMVGVAANRNSDG